MTVSKEIIRKIRSFRKGKPFRSNGFLELGSRAAVDQVLSRLVKSGEIKRIKRGLFVKPERNVYVGEVLPGAEEIARFLTQQAGAKLAISGAEAARRFGFTTQVSSQSVFLTDGPSREYYIGNHKVSLKRVTPQKLALAGRPAGDALSALWYLGKSGVTPQTFEQIEGRLSPEEFSVLTQKQEVMPGWMRDTLSKYQEERHIA